MSELNEEPTSPEKSEPTAEEREREIALWLTEWQKTDKELSREYALELNIPELARDLAEHPLYYEFIKAGIEENKERLDKFYRAGPDLRYSYIKYFHDAESSVILTIRGLIKFEKRMKR